MNHFNNKNLSMICFAGNKTLTPASPDVVAQIIAQAELKMKTDPTNLTTPDTSPSKVCLVKKIST